MPFAHSVPAPGRRIVLSDDDGYFARPIVPTVDYSDVPRIRIYDASNDGSYWYRRIGFTLRSIAEDD